MGILQDISVGEDWLGINNHEDCNNDYIEQHSKEFLVSLKYVGTAHLPIPSSDSINRTLDGGLTSWVIVVGLMHMPRSWVGYSKGTSIWKPPRQSSQSDMLCLVSWTLHLEFQCIDILDNFTEFKSSILIVGGDVVCLWVPTLMCHSQQIEPSEL